MRIRRYFSPLFKTTLAVAALWWVSRGMDVDEFIRSWLTADPVLLAGAVGIFLITPVLQGVRLQRLLTAQKVRTGIGENVRLAFAGNFMNFAVPVGSTTGDVYKAAYLGRRTDRSWEAVVTTFVDRGIGVATLVLSVTAICLVAGPASPLAPLRGILVLGSAGLLALAAALRWFPLEGRTRGWIRRLPRHQTAIRIVETARVSLRSIRVLGLAVLDTLGIQVAAAASFLCAALALGFVVVPSDWLDMYVFFSSGEVVKALPGPPQGLGTLEAAYGAFFREWATTSQIVSAALAVRAINLVCSLPGLPSAIGSLPHLASRTAPRCDGLRPATRDRGRAARRLESAVSLGS